MSVQSQLEAALRQQFAPEFLQVDNESHQHHVPPGSESHFKVQLVAEGFEGRRQVQRHQLVYAALGPLMQSIHALALHTWAPSEWQGQAAAASPQCQGGSKAG